MLTHVLLPGRHHLLTRFQARYLADLLAGRATDTDAQRLELAPDATVVWAVTSANHQNTRRNPVPGHRREAAIERFSAQEGLRSLVVPVVDVPATDRFAALVVASVGHATGGRCEPDPATTVVACSTPAVLRAYRALGYRVAPVELDHPEAPLRPWEVLGLLAAGDGTWRDHAHPATVDLVDRYALDDLVRTVTADPVVGSEGSLTDTRDYRTYSRAFEDAADRKWAQARPFVRPGRIVDIGCATGAMLERAAADPALAECDLIGVEVSRHLYEECRHKLEQGVFANPSTFFHQRNVMAGPVAAPGSVDTSLTFALTHEILSYAGGLDGLRRFVAAVAEQTAPGGVWINSDVCGPEDPDTPVHLVFHEPGLHEPAVDLAALGPEAARAHLEARTPAGRVAQFAQDFRRHTGTAFAHTVLDDRTLALRLGDAMELLSKHTYTDSWLSETHEQFCAVTWDGWRELVTAAGLEVDERSGPWRNEWVVEHLLAAAATLTTPAGQPLPWPTTHVLLVARRPVLSS
ncbi:hypothetical protein GCM10027047_18480 [Rhodococcus aerolatus]